VPYETSIMIGRNPWSGTASGQGRFMAKTTAHGYAPSRVCCVRVSTYNSNSTCWLHSEVRYPTPPGGRSRSSAARSATKTPPIQESR
jgi:hypothetical protein